MTPRTYAPAAPPGRVQGSVAFGDPVEVGEVGVIADLLFAHPGSDVGLVGCPDFIDAGAGQNGDGAHLKIAEAVVTIGGGTGDGHVPGVLEAGRREFPDQPPPEGGVLGFPGRAVVVVLGVVAARTDDGHGRSLSEAVVGAWGLRGRDAIEPFIAMVVVPYGRFPADGGRTLVWVTREGPSAGSVRTASSTRPRATGGDPRCICGLFGLSVGAALRYTGTIVQACTVEYNLRNAGGPRPEGSADDVTSGHEEATGV